MTQISETQTTENKQSFGVTALKTLAALANTDGGTVLIGIKDDGTTTNKTFSNEEVEQITESTVNKLGLHPDVSIEEQILKISVHKSSIPISFNGKYYKRVGNTTREVFSG